MLLENVNTPQPPKSSENLENDPRTVDAGMIFVTLIWGTNFVVVKAAFSQMPPLAFTALRFVITALTFALLLISREGLKRLPPGSLTRMIWLGFVGNTLYQALFAVGLSMTTTANSALLLSTTPAFLAVGSGLLGIERITRRMILGIALALTGVLLVMMSSGVAFSRRTLTGDLITLGSVFCWVAYVLGVRTVNARISSLQLTALSMIAGTPALLLLGAPDLAQLEWRSLSPGVWLGMLYSAWFSLVIAYLLYNRSVRRIGSVQTSIYGCAIPLIAALVAWPVLGEELTAWQGAGGALIIVGVLTTRRGNNEPQGKTGELEVPDASA